MIPKNFNDLPQHVREVIVDTNNQIYTMLESTGRYADYALSCGQTAERHLAARNYKAADLYIERMHNRVCEASHTAGTIWAKAYYAVRDMREAALDKADQARTYVNLANEAYARVDHNYKMACPQ